MGAYAVLGIGIQKGKLYRMEKKRGCSHEVPAGQEFCEKCGKKREVEERLFIGGDETSQLGKHSIFSAENAKDSDIVVVGAGAEYRSSMTAYADNVLSDYPVRPVQIDKARLILKDLFAHYKLDWDEENFGIWAYASY